MLVQCSRECTLPNLSTGISNLLQPAQAEVVLGQRSTYLASWGGACCGEYTLTPSAGTVRSQHPLLHKLLLRYNQGVCLSVQYSSLVLPFRGVSASLLKHFSSYSALFAFSHIKLKELLETSFTVLHWPKCLCYTAGKVGVICCPSRIFFVLISVQFNNSYSNHWRSFSTVGLWSAYY
jgi:hypothetical protein